jgi:2-methylisocitrate lyase-like PEP mutase family enzyme
MSAGSNLRKSVEAENPLARSADEFVVMARTDAVASEGLKAAIELPFF